jgi:DNA repair protein RecN (Recombination protein N)
MLNEGENSISDRLGDIYRDLQEIEKIAPEKGSDLLSSCDQMVQLARDLALDIENFAGNIELDEREFLELEERLSSLQTLKRRYGPTLEQVFDVMEDTRKRLEQFKNSEELRERFEHREKELGAKLEAAAAELTGKRMKASAKFAKEVKAELNKLGFLKCEFEVEFSRVEPGQNGADKIDFIFSANPGERSQPLRNIASSGEMSRVMLALKTVLAGADSIPILLFDEIDVNIGGETASVVGEELKKLATSHQVLCISHLAQVAASADNHYRVEKSVSKGRTSTGITLLDKKARAQELGRMLGGTSGALTHAKELLKK